MVCPRPSIPSSILVFLALFTLILPARALAQSAVGVAPAAKLYTALPGETINATLTIDNPSPNEASQTTVRAYLGDWDQDASGQPKYYPAGTLERSASSWVTLSSSELKVQGGTSSQLRYSLNVPMNATPGTHWTMLFLESVAPDAKPGQIAAFRVRVAHVIYVNVPPVKEGGKIVGMFATLPEVPSNPVELGVQYANIGNTAVAVEGRVEIRGERGDLALTVPIPVTVVLPGAVQLLPAGFFGPLEPGQYTALAVLSGGNHTQDIAGETVFELKWALEAPGSASSPTVVGPVADDKPAPASPTPGGAP